MYKSSFYCKIYNWGQIWHQSPLWLGSQTLKLAKYNGYKNIGHNTFIEKSCFIHQIWFFYFENLKKSPNGNLQIRRNRGKRSEVFQLISIIQHNYIFVWPKLFDVYPGLNFVWIILIYLLFNICVQKFRQKFHIFIIFVFLAKKMQISAIFEHFNFF